MQNDAGTVRFEGVIATSAGSSDTAIAITSGTARVFNPNDNSSVSSLAHSDVASGFPKTADALTTDDVVFFFALEVEDVITMVKSG